MLEKYKEKLTLAIEYSQLKDESKTSLDKRKYAMLEKKADKQAELALATFYLDKLRDEARMVGMDSESICHLLYYEREIDVINEKISKGLWYIQAKQYKTPAQKDLALKRLSKLREHKANSQIQCEIIYEEYEKLREMA